MQLYVYNPNMEMLGVIEKIESLIWTRRYWEAGEFKLLVPFSEEHNQLLKENNIVLKHGDEEAAEIESVDVSKNLEGFEVIEIHGKFLSHWIKKRLILTPLVNVIAPAPQILRRMVDENCITTTAARVIPNLSLAEGDDLSGPELTYNSEPYANLYEAGTELAQGSKIGFRMLTDRATGLHTFSVYKGRDYTDGNNEGNPPCIFSQEYDNVLEQEYSTSTENYRNVAYVTGEMKDNNTCELVVINGSSSGLERNELYVPASDIKQTYTDDNDREVTLTDEEYRKALADRGSEKLEQHTVSQLFSSEINTGANLVYRKDFDLGDRVTCVNKKWNVRIDARITEISEIYELEGEALEINFGESIPSLYKQIKQMTGG